MVVELQDRIATDIIAMVKYYTCEMSVEINENFK